MIYQLIKFLVDRRWVILQHRLAKDSLDGLHYDLLFEDVEDCRTWRLSSFPLLDGPSIQAIMISPHKLHWLERNESVVSGGRGWAKRICGGTFVGLLPLYKKEMLSVEITGNVLQGSLKILDGFCRITSNSKFDFI